MSPPISSSAAYQMAAFPGLLLAQTQQEMLDAAHQEEMARLLRGGSQSDHSSDFAAFVLLPVLVCLGLIVLGRRLFS